jgi:hypothetical protein
MFGVRMKWSHDGNLANQMSLLLFMFQNFASKTSRFIPLHDVYSMLASALPKPD